MTQQWELKMVENMGELPGTLSSEEVIVPTKTLTIDMKAQLMFYPKNFTWTVGWRAYVWQEKETGRFKDLTDDEFKQLSLEGTLSYSRDVEGSDRESTDSTKDEGINS